MSKTGLQAINQQNKLAQWSSQIAACRSSGQTVSQWCEEHRIPKSTYYNWQRKVYHAVSTENTFVEITMDSPVKDGDTVAAVTIGTVTAEIRSGADEATMAALFRAMKTC